jgi:hypothetical protein
MNDNISVMEKRLNELIGKYNETVKKKIQFECQAKRQSVPLRNTLQDIEKLKREVGA